ncbi:gluconate 2-dehydrogenase subunit 3 family protein [Bdellovibrio sp. NC01]|uniref:gluconate 2-dehydrogenase subunit 3 family protein n=1 Tax=Bdellovibrio sp. NC01 TaxID=2220073 RepID=UPI001AF01719|nr:gluconate 2-dehydrogenase subunit 3 family protein [Bdellovibrio sp. NC01]
MEEESTEKFEVSRREALKIAATGLLASLPIAGIAEKAEAAVTKSKAATTPTKKPVKTTYIFLNKQEAAFIEAATARLIPADEKWGGAIEAGVPNYIDKQLGGSWGAGERLYRSGPWQVGTKTQGYQLPFTPAELFRTALKALNKQMKTPLNKMSPDQQDSFLKELEKGGADLDGVPSAVFFSSLLQLTMEGFFSDPVYGGNYDMISWRMIGFPGAYGSYYDVLDKHGIKIDRAPMSLAEDSMGKIHQHSNIPASLGTVKGKGGK